MANMILEYRLSPDPEVEKDIEELLPIVEKTVREFDQSVNLKKIDKVELGFGILGVIVEFELDEKLGSQDIEDKLLELREIGSAECLKMDRL